MKIIAIIPVRYNSSRFIGKPLALIHGKPMIEWVYRRVVSSASIDKVYVATDDLVIKNLVNSFKGEVIMTSSSHVSGTDRISEAIERIKISDNDLIINIQGDQPLINIKCLEELIFSFENNKKLNMATLAIEIKDKKEIRNPKNVKVVLDANGYAIYFSRSIIPNNRDIDNKNIKIYKHLGIYGYKKSFIKIFKNLPIGILENIEKLEQLRVIEHGYSILIVKTNYDSPEVDTKEDIKYIENKISQKYFF